MKISQSTTRLLACLSLLCSAAHADVLVVAPSLSAGVDVTTVQEAIDLALDGDTILVRNGTYERFVVTAKSLTVIADGSGVTARYDPPVNANGGGPAIEVLDLLPHQEVVVRGFRTNFGVRILDCEGAVWFDDLDVFGSMSLTQCARWGTPGASIARSDRVTFTNSNLRGDDGSMTAWIEGPAGTGASVSDSKVSFWNCSLLGGTGANAVVFYATSGGDGLSLDSAEVTLVGCTLTGGWGGLRGGSTCTTTHAVGGDGLQFGTLGGTVMSAATTAVGGARNLAPLCPGQYGPSGDAIAGTGTIVPLPGYAHGLLTNSPVRSGQTARFTVSGQPGEVPMILLSETHAPLSLPQFSGSLLVGLPLVDTLVLAPLTASAAASLSVPVPNVALAAGAVTYVSQAVFFAPGGGVSLGSGSTLTLLDATY